MSGFMSYMSMWLAPPCRNMKITLICFPPPPAASLASTSDNGSPSGEIAASDSPPILKNSRRSGPCCITLTSTDSEETHPGTQTSYRFDEDRTIARSRTRKAADHASSWFQSSTAPTIVRSP